MSLWTFVLNSGDGSASQDSSSILGRVTTQKIGTQEVRDIEGITTLEPAIANRILHGLLFRKLSREDQVKFQQAQQDARQRILTLVKLVGGTARFVLPESVFTFWLTPSDEKTIARESYGEDGRAYPSIDIDDVQKCDQRTVTHYLGHEFVHLFSLHQTYKSAGKTAAGLQYEVTIFQVGLCFRQTSKFTVQGIQRHHWDEWAKTIFKIDRQFKAGKSTVSLEGISRVALQLIHIFKEKFGSDWLEQAKATICSKVKELYKIRTWTAEVKLVTGQELNETLTEFLARILSCNNMLAPTSDEIQWFKDTGIYGNLDGINQLMQVYCSIENQADRIAYLGSLIKSLQYADLTYFLEEIRKYDKKASPSEALMGKVAPQFASNS